MDESKEFILKRESKNTKYSTNTSYNFFKNYCLKHDELRNLQDIPPVELNLLVARALKDSVKGDGKFYEPHVLSTYYRGLQRYLIEQNYSVNISSDESFVISRDVLAAKRKEIVNSGGGRKPNATRELSDDEEDILFDNGYFGSNDPIALRNVIWWLVSLNFGFRTRHEARQLKWGDIELGYDADGRECLEWNRERRINTTTSSEQRRTVSSLAYASGTQRCLIRYYKLYCDRRPRNSFEQESPFFLQTHHKGFKMGSQIWYSNSPLGENKIGEILSVARKRFGFGGKRIANHSVRKTSIGRVLDNEVPVTFVALKSYNAPSKKHKLETSDDFDVHIVQPSTEEIDMTCGKSHSATVEKPSSHSTEPSESSHNTILVQSNVTNINSHNSLISSILQPGQFSNCTNCTFNFNINVSPEKDKKKRSFRLRVVSSSDEDEL